MDVRMKKAALIAALDEQRQALAHEDNLDTIARRHDVVSVAKKRRQVLSGVLAWSDENLASLSIYSLRDMGWPDSVDACRTTRVARLDALIRRLQADARTLFTIKSNTEEWTLLHFRPTITCEEK